MKNTNVHNIRLLIIDSARILPAAAVQKLAQTKFFSLIGHMNDWEQARTLSLAPEGVCPDVLLYSISPASSREMVFNHIGECSPKTKSLLLVTDENDANILPALKKGTNGYVNCNSPTSVIVQAVAGVYRGEAVLSPRILSKILDQLKEQRV